MTVLPQTDTASAADKRPWIAPVLDVMPAVEAEAKTFDPSDPLFAS
ncbi:hypothetical protein [Brevundimonas sp.]|nr:hypothetical protein [Brevundimonas sp.]MDZ4363253.1 hypothetical protein [Brevundimonas sp.]